jgi:isopentenyl diphosphate isomerase/L-lactate dehydrogenase-like FMN-dependent dehydrogenase
MSHSDFQYEIYLGGLSGKKPAFPIAPADLEERARAAMSPEAWGYVAGAAGTESTMRANLDAFKQWRIVPRMLRDVAERDLSVELAGEKLDSPVLLAPIGVQSIVHPEAERAAARAANDVGIPIVLSTASSTPMEDIAEVSADNLRWFQLYWPADPKVTESFVRRAESSGYRAIVVTLDTMLLAWRPRDLQQAFLPFLQGVGIAQYLSDPEFRAGLDKPPEEDIAAAVMRWAQIYSDPSSTWERLRDLRAMTKLPLFLKGILHPDDARLAIEAGMDGVIVSNHGGRQVDGAIASVNALPDVVDAVADRVPVLFDSGIRGAADAVKALALGARAVLLGRPYIWGLAIGGADGVRQVLRSFLAELDLTLALAGCSSVATLDRSLLQRV